MPQDNHQHGDHDHEDDQSSNSSCEGCGCCGPTEFEFKDEDLTPEVLKMKESLGEEAFKEFMIGMMKEM